LAQCDVLVIDLADVGSRYYTYVWTALIAARAAVNSGVHVVVLDRPNPISGDPRTLEGAPQQPEVLSFVGLESIPIRHALTLGDPRHPSSEMGKRLTRRCAQRRSQRGWERYRTAEAWGDRFHRRRPTCPRSKPPLFIPGLLVEGTNLSEGRGTTRRFSSWSALRRRAARAGAHRARRSRSSCARCTSAELEKHAGMVCSGVLVQVTEPHCFGLFRRTWP
jgi:uncharacterized protein YbbC (DUF1343 family)